MNYVIAMSTYVLAEKLLLYTLQVSHMMSYVYILRVSICYHAKKNMLRIPRLVLEGELEEQAVNLGGIQIRGEPNELKTKTSHVLEKLTLQDFASVAGSDGPAVVRSSVLKEDRRVFKHLQAFFLACVISLLLAFQGELLLPQQL